MQVQLTQSRDSGVSGTATLEDVEGGTQVALNMQGLPEPDVEHMNHIHGGAGPARTTGPEGPPR
jgi:hypothetical protein